MNTVVELLPEILRKYLYVVLFVSTMAAWGCTITYTIMSPRWYANELGRHMVSFTGCLALFLTFYVTRLFWPNLPGREFYLIFLFTLFAGVLVWRFVMFLRLLIEKRRIERARSQHDDVDESLREQSNGDH